MTGSLFDQYKAALRRGHLAVIAGELEEALDAYEAAARLVPDRPLPPASRGTVLHRLDRWPEAAESFDRALSLAPDDEAALRARATARAERGLRSGAASDFERLALVLDVSGRAREAADAARRAVELESTDSRLDLAARLGADAAQLPEAVAPSPTGAPSVAADDDLAEQPAVDPRLALLETAPPEPPPDVHSVAYDALDALRAGMDAEERGDAAEPAIADAAPAPDASPGPEPDRTPAATAEHGSEPGDAVAEGEQAWPPIDLPSPPPPPIEGPPPDPEALLAEAALVLESGEVDAARDLMLTAVQVHREAGRIDAAIDICLTLLEIAPGDPRVHLAIANLQLDRGWTAVASEKLDLLVRLTSLTGDTQAEADVHGLASERLRDEPAGATPGR